MHARLVGKRCEIGGLQFHGGAIGAEAGGDEFAGGVQWSCSGAGRGELATSTGECLGLCTRDNVR
jgi:hypothetical protein